MILEINNLAFPVGPLKLQQNANTVIIHGALAPETQLEHRKNSLLSSFKNFASKQSEPWSELSLSGSWYNRLQGKGQGFSSFSIQVNRMSERGS